MSKRCDQCEALMIQGLFCHETGCTNEGARYDVESDTWIKRRKCFECGCTVDKDDPCCNRPPEDDEPVIATFGDAERARESELATGWLRHMRGN